MTEPQPLLTPEEVGDWLKLPTAGVLYLVRTGKLSAVRMNDGKPARWRFRHSAVEDFINASTTRLEEET